MRDASTRASRYKKTNTSEYSSFMVELCAEKNTNLRENKQRSGDINRIIDLLSLCTVSFLLLLLQLLAQTSAGVLLATFGQPKAAAAITKAAAAWRVRGLTTSARTAPASRSDSSSVIAA